MLLFEIAFYWKVNSLTILYSLNISVEHLTMNIHVTSLFILMLTLTIIIGTIRGIIIASSY